MSGLSQKSSEVSDSDATGVPEKRRQRSMTEKQRIVEASFKPGTSVGAVAKAHGLHPTQLYKWRRLYGRKREGSVGARLLPVRVAEESIKPSRPARKAANEESEAARAAIIHVEFATARLRIESADRATVLAILEHLAR
jgi:transposase